MQYRHLYPMVRVLLPFMAGIIVCISLSSTTPVNSIIWLIMLLLTIATGLIPFSSPRFIKSLLFGIVASLFLFISGYNSVLLHKEILRPDHFSNMQLQGVYIAEVLEPLQEKDHSFKTILGIKGIKQGDSIIKAEGRILTYFAKDSTKRPADEGSLIVFSARIQEISPPMNPGAFNYKKYMGSNNVYHQVYLNPINWNTLEPPSGFSLMQTAHKVSRFFVHKLNENGLKGQEFAVAAALLLGQNDMLDNETRQAYSGSGVTHILSVSGLHVGVIFIIINFLLGFMKKEGSQLYLKTLLILLTIWAYALLTGMSPPVMRSAAMFTFITIGNASKRYVHIINSLAVSAIFLLLINPLIISNIGFQLSYLAIIGIVFINKPIADLINPGNKILDQIWSLIAVSLAAQIATAPLTMLYFHQFPTYFIPANLIAIPLSFLAIYAGVAVLAVSAIPVISNFLGLITNYLLYALNFSVDFIEKLPYSVIPVTSVFQKEMILLYFILVSVLLVLHIKKKSLIFVLLSFSLILSASFSYTETVRQKQQKLIFYSSGKQTAIGFLAGKQQTLIADSVLLNDEKANKFQFEGARAFYGITSANAFALDTIIEFYQNLPNDLKMLRGFGNNFLFHDKRLVLINDLPKPEGECPTLRVDYLYVRQNPNLHIKELQLLYNPEFIIFDGTNSFNKTDKWMEECKKAGIKAYSLRDTGAHIVDL